MIETCLLFALGLTMHTGNYVCSDYPDVSQYDLKVTAYDPALGGINCMEPCHLTGAGYVVADWYEQLAACPLELMGHTVVIDGRPWLCGDAGGAIVIDHETRQVRVDLLRVLHDEQGNYRLPDDGFVHAVLGAERWEVR